MFDVWKNAISEIENQIDRSSFVTWFNGCELLGIENGVATISTGDTFKKKNLETKYSDLIKEALNNNGEKVSSVEFKIVSKAKTKGREITSESSEEKRSGGIEKISIKDLPKQVSKSIVGSNLNPKYTMDGFVIGSNNDLAVSVAKAVIEYPGERYNPFFLYGGPGLGKTHLVQAIGNELLKRNPKLKVLYTPVNHFYSEYIAMIKNGQRDDFAEKYRKLDVLIIDDFQMIVGKDASQEQFFNIFNDLYQANKQIIVTSDRLPSQIKTLDERLSSRLAMGGEFDLQMPNFEDKCAILKSKAEFMGADIENEAIEFLADAVKTNIRDLESEFSRILAVSDLRGITPLQLIRDGYTSTAKAGGRVKGTTSKKVVDIVAKYYELTVDEMLSKSRVSKIKTARQVAMYMLSKEMSMSTNKIAMELGMKDHTTIMNGLKKIEKDMKDDFELREQIGAIKDKIYE